ncbi:Putative protein KIAA1210 [Fukomys damarensis]|uniref:Uncharacterized protein n=2 Tax=Fukomys damarensis TaxID=885580 RepID=A0A091E702_FUKDA|nr:Putative protein KIAA1210 [Fukomys damarensis]
MSAAADVTIFENNSGSWFPPKGPVSPTKTKKHSQGSEDFTQSISTSAPKPGKFITARTWKIPFSRDTYYKGEILQSGDRSNDDHSHLLTSEAEADVENLPGIQQKRMSSPHSYKKERPASFTQLPSLPLGPISSSRGREQQMRRGASQAFLDTTDSLTTPPTRVEKYQSRAKYEGVAKKQPTYKIPGKPVRQSDYYVSDPAWFTMARQKHEGSQVYTPVKETKTKSRAGPKTDTKEYRHGTRPEAAQKTPQKVAGATD